MLISALVANATEDPAFDPTTAAGRIRALVIAFLAVALAVCSVYGVFVYARKGAVGKALTMAAAVLICLLPVALAAPIALGKDITAWLGF
jgi:hypothetical protein